MATIDEIRKPFPNPVSIHENAQRFLKLNEKFDRFVVCKVAL